MRQRAIRYGSLGLLLAVCLVWLMPFGRTEVKAPAGAKAQPKKETRKERPAVAILKKLLKPINLDRGFDAGTSLKDTLELLSDRHQLTIIIDSQAFLDPTGEVGDVEQVPVKLPRIANIPLGTVLRLVLAQVPLGATYLIRNEFIEIVPARHVTSGRILRQKVTAAFDKKPLDEALEELADGVGVSVIVDQSLGDKARTPVKATFKNDLSLETAVRLLADMAELQAVRVGNALYVTSRAKADALRTEEEKKKNDAERLD
jgi:hypothetical protein